MDNRLKQLRLEHGYSTRELAEALTKNGFETTSMTISRYERGEREPKLATWQKLADFFGVSVPYIQGIQDVKNHDDFLSKLKILNTRPIRNENDAQDVLRELRNILFYDQRDLWEKIYEKLPSTFEINDFRFSFLTPRQKLELAQVMYNVLDNLLSTNVLDKNEDQENKEFDIKIANLWKLVDNQFNGLK